MIGLCSGCSNHIHRRLTFRAGINLEFAKLLLSRGCNVVLADLSLRPEAEAVVATYGAEKSPRAVFVSTDVTSWPALQNMFKTTIAEFGNFDLLCPGAGVYEPSWSSFWHPPGSEQSRDEADGGRYSLMDINVTHPIRATQIALQYWLHPEAGPDGTPRRKPVSTGNPKRVVHLSSVAGQLPVFRAPLYGASKYAISGFVRCLAPLEETYGIRVNAVAPGVVRTPLWTDNPDKLGNIDQEDGWVTPEEVAKAMLALAEEERYPAGTVLEIGRDQVRKVEVLNDPGPDNDPKSGLVTRNSAFGDDQIWALLQDSKTWVPPPE